MVMNKIKFCGGYGEHGRSCFLVEYRDEHYYMFDCGILDTDPNPYPHIMRDLIKKVDYLFLSHCHKDHSGAFMWLVENGFCGLLIASEITIRLSKIRYDKLMLLSVESDNAELPGISFVYGRTGHCPGSLWFRVKDEIQTILYSGDYQKNSYLYQCDPIIKRYADIAIIDKAHNQSELNAAQLREVLWHYIEKNIQEKMIVLPVPKYGRGVELAYFLLMKLDGINKKLDKKQRVELMVDSEFVECLKEMTEEIEWFRTIPERFYDRVIDIKQEILLSIDRQKGKMKGILLIADTHLATKENAIFVKKEIEQGAEVVITGRLRAGSLCEQLFLENKAKRFLYPHHQSKVDVKEMVEQNEFSMVFPFHNEEMELLYRQ